MLLTLIGISLTLFPFLLLFCFKNRLIGFLYILGSIITIHLLTAFLSQFFHFFLFPIIITIHSVIALLTLYILYKKYPSISFNLNLNWFVIFSFFIIIFQLWSVHFFYTGTISTLNEYQTVSRSSYPYPYFSDEWIGVSFSNYSIEHNALPIKNPIININKNNNFPNIFVFFFSLISELFLILSITPLFGYAFFSIFTGFLICFLIFILLRVNKINLFPSLLASLCIPYIINGLNLPGIWYLLPFTGGVILFLLSLIGLSIEKYFFATSMSVISLLLYPPMIVLIAPIYLVYLIFKQNIENVKKIKIFLGSLLVLILVILLIIYIQNNNIKQLFNILTTSIWRPSFDMGIPLFHIWKVIPFILLPFSIIGLIRVFRTKNYIILIPTLVGLFLWLLYSYSQFYFIIDFARIVVITSFFMIILSGFGFNEILKKVLIKYPSFFKKNMILFLKIAFIFIFIILSFFYTDRLGWKNLVLKVKELDSVFYFMPSAPASNFLIQDDINLFNSFSKKRFLAPPWKGLVISVATNNYPLDSKESIVSNKFLSYDEFTKKSCEEKELNAKKFRINYIYSNEFNCKNFIFVGQSKEGLYLYKFNF